jgi:hypothetical protein
LNNIIDSLVVESQKYNTTEDFVSNLVSQMRSVSPTRRNLEYAVGSLRAAVEAYLGDQSETYYGVRCRFCAKSRKDVRALYVSAESTICEECVVIALHAMSHERFYLRIAFFMFRVVASLGRLFIW